MLNLVSVLLLFSLASQSVIRSPGSVSLRGVAIRLPEGWSVYSMKVKSITRSGAAVTLVPKGDYQGKPIPDLHLSLVAEPRPPAEVLGSEDQPFSFRDGVWYFRSSPSDESVRANEISGKGVSGAYACRAQASDTARDKPALHVCTALLLGNGWAFDLSFPEEALPQAKAVISSIVFERQE